VTGSFAAEIAAASHIRQEAISILRTFSPKKFSRFRPIF
jgi:hypothetical protein